ncbi:MAG: formyltransferase family protein [Mariprofundaceae bacterium]|nr:formyltransferase family protein [Mariprofundaceae bacterium]
MKQPKITLFISTSMAFPIVQQLIQRQQLAGVVLTARVDADSMQLEQQLQHMQLPFIRYNEQDTQPTIHFIQTLSSQLGLIATFTHILPEALLSCFSLGLYNVHASLLPAYRGANPLFWQLKNNEKESAVLIHKVEKTADTGGIVASYKFDIHPLDTFGTLSGSVFQVMPLVINEFLDLIAEHGQAIARTEQQGEVCQAPQPSQQDVSIDWSSMTASEICALARACNPNLGGAQLRWKSAQIGLMQANVVDKPMFGVPAGTIMHIGAPEGLLVATKEFALCIDVVYMMDGVFSGLQFAERFSLNAGEKFLNQV